MEHNNRKVEHEEHEEKAKNHGEYEVKKVESKGLEDQEHDKRMEKLNMLNMGV